MDDTIILDRILKSEGGFVNDPLDRGGATNHGITQGVLSEWRGRPASVDDVRNLTVDEARDIYRRRYIEAPGFWQITDPFVRAAVVDAGVNSGPVRAIRWLQMAVGTKPDGVLGPKTLRATNSGDARKIIGGVCAYRLRFLAALVAGQPTQLRFLQGWINRVTDFLIGD